MRPVTPGGQREEVVKVSHRGAALGMSLTLLSRGVHPLNEELETNVSKLLSRAMVRASSSDQKRPRF